MNREGQPAVRRPWVAAVLSLFCLGTGHIYCGKIAKGLVLLFGQALISNPVPFYLLILRPSETVWAFMGLQFLVSGAIAIYGVIDAYRLAKRIGQNYVLRKYNRPFIYGLLLLVQGTYLAGMSAVDISRLKAFYIPSSGMAPTINNGDRIIVNKWAYLREPVRHGDVIVHQGVKNPKRRFVRRVVAVAGETIAVTNGHVRVNGSKLERTPTKTEDGQSAYTERNGAASYEILFEPSDEPPPDFAEATVPDDAVFVLGDNRNHTHDSRRFGFVPSDNVVGKVMLKYWPIGEMRKFGSFMD